MLLLLVEVSLSLERHSCVREAFSSTRTGAFVGWSSEQLWLFNESKGIFLQAKKCCLEANLDRPKGLNRFYSKCRQERDHELKIPTAHANEDHTRTAVVTQGAVIAIHYGHDANIAIAKHGKVQCVLELERYFGRRYMTPWQRTNEFHWIMIEALKIVRDNCVCDEGVCPSTFDEGVLMDLAFYKPVVSAQIPFLVEQIFGKVARWRHVHHHEGCAFCFYLSSFFKNYFFGFVCLFVCLLSQASKRRA